MNAIVDKFLLSGDIFMPEMYLRQPGFTYSACGPLTKHKERIKQFKETEDSRYINQNELDKACFQHDMVYGDLKDLNRRTAAHQALRDKAFDIAEDPKCDDINMYLLQWSINVLIKNLLIMVLNIFVIKN